MVLSSQSPRAGYGGGSMRSGRRSAGRWKAALILLAVVAGAYFLFFRGGEEPGADADTSQAQTPTTDTTTADLGTSPPTTASRTPPKIDAPPEEVTPKVSAPPEVSSQASPEVSPTASEPPADPATGIVTRHAARPAVTTAGQAGEQLREGFQMIDDGNTIVGRAQLSALLLGSLDKLSANDADLIRQRLADLNAQLVFSPQPVANDPATGTYRVQPGDVLGGIARHAKVPYPLLEMVNGIQANRMQAGQSIKLLNGPVHARVIKSAFIMDLYIIGTDGTPVFLAAFPVGLGENDNTPHGKWTVAAGKVTNPDWRNPRTNEYFPANHPDNPIGEYWIPITGLEGDAVGRTGFGIHGTNEPDSIGKNRSMGCVRLADADIAMVYNMLAPGHSTIDILP